eukprot:11379215-Alexandrium_andersonii.AAC.1
MSDSDGEVSWGFQEIEAAFALLRRAFQSKGKGEGGKGGPPEQSGGNIKGKGKGLSLIHISEPTRLALI